MAQVTALEKHACAACGAQAAWNPSRQALICSFCGTVAPGELDADTGKVREIDLAQALREMPDELRGWQTERRSVRCRSCHAVSVFDPQHVGRNCEFCGSTELVDYEEIKSPLRPQSLLPFKVDETRVREHVRRWYAGRWFAPGKFKRLALVDTIRGVYIPYWTFDARVHCPWTAQSGTYYYTTQTYRDSSGRTRRRQVRHVRWRPAAGEIDHFFDDHPIPGTRGVDHGLLRRIEPFPTNDLVPYDTAYLSGFVVEHYQIVLLDAARAARESMNAELSRMCAAQVPGDTHRDLRIHPEYSGETFKHVLVPVWLLVYRYRGKPYQLVVNGSTGGIAGRYPKSFWKIFFLVAAAAAAIAAFALIRGLQG
jgi:hypothetical protein